MSDSKALSVNQYTWSEKTDAAKRWIVLGNMRLVSEVTGIPYNTLHDWRKQDWWSELINEVRNGQKAQRNTKMNTVIEDSIEVIHDRILNGDVILNNKTGELQRKPVNLRDVGNLTNQLLTRQMQMEELSDRMESRKETVQETLSMLAKEFTKWQRIQNKQNATDVEVIEDAVHEEREAGLQEGSSSVHLETRSQEEAS